MPYQPRWTRKSRAVELPTNVAPTPEADKEKNLFDGFGEAVGLIVETLVSEGLEAEAVLKVLATGDWVREAADPVYASLRKGLPPLIGYLKRGEKRIAADMDTVWGPPDRVYRAATYLAYELGRIATEDSAQGNPKLQVLLGLQGRALRTAAEVRLLAVNGFGSGATARSRSLHELAILAWSSRDPMNRLRCATLPEPM